MTEKIRDATENRAFSKNIFWNFEKVLFTEILL